MESTNNQTESRDVLINCASVDLEDETSRLITDTLGVSVLYGKVENTRKLVYGICIIVLLMGAILGILVGLSIVKQNNIASNAIDFRNLVTERLSKLNQTIVRSEALLTIVCKAEFGQTSVVCRPTNSSESH